MTQLIEALRATAVKWRAGNPEHIGGIVLVWEGEVYGWKNELRDPASERPIKIEAASQEEVEALLNKALEVKGKGS